MEKRKTLRPEEIEKICNKQYMEKGAVLPPQYCLACQKCAVGFLVKSIGEQDRRRS